MAIRPRHSDGPVIGGTVRLLGITHQTLDHREFEIEACAMHDSGGNYDLMVFDICRVLPSQRRHFSLGVGFPKTFLPPSEELLDILMQSALLQVRRQLDRGCEEEDRVFEPFNYGLAPKPAPWGS
ncbi:MAG: hypothetical protein F4Y67_02690 [Chloroflexi bacterium]|nr:hypothetical protein [Chloroflexota bacterium]